MKKISSILLIAFVTSISTTFLFGCARWNQSKVEAEFGSPVKKEMLDDKTIYQYHYFGRMQRCLDFTFDKSGKLISKREYYGERCNSQQIDSWLATSGGEPPAINTTGKWRDAQGGVFGWGEGYLQQEQNKIRGTIGGCNVKGVVSGKIVYLVFLSEGVVYYRARLEMMLQDLLVGDFFKENDSKGSSMSLERQTGGTK